MPGCGSRSRRSSSATSASSPTYGQTWNPRHARLTAQTTWARSARTSAREVVPFGVETIAVSSHSGAFSGTRFWKNDDPLGPVRKALHERRPPARAAQERLLDREVVVDEVELRLPRSEEDLVRARDRDAAPGDLQGVLLCHAPEPYRDPGADRCSEGVSALQSAFGRRSPTDSSDVVADVFISYSRADGVFVRELHDFLTGRGKDVWVDWEDIPPAAEWEEDIDDSIDAAESFVFVISRNSLASRYSLDELHHAQERGKRIVPIACDGADPNQAPEGLRQLNWIWCRPTTSRPQRSRSCSTRSTRTSSGPSSTRASSSARSSGTSGATRASSCGAATSRTRASRSPPTPARNPFRLSCNGVPPREPARLDRRQRIVLGSVSFALVVAIGLALVALVQRNLANDRARTARSQALAAQATAALDTAPAGARGLRPGPRDGRDDEARLALRRALLANPVEYASPPRPHAPRRPAGRPRLLGRRPRAGRPRARRRAARPRQPYGPRAVLASGRLVRGGRPAARGRPPARGTRRRRADG